MSQSSNQFFVLVLAGVVSGVVAQIVINKWFRG